MSIITNQPRRRRRVRDEARVAAALELLDVHAQRRRDARQESASLSRVEPHVVAAARQSGLTWAQIAARLETTADALRMAQRRSEHTDAA